jgi:hypothetical protein
MKKSLHCRSHRWKENATAVTNRDINLPIAGAKRKFRERNGLLTSPNNMFKQQSSNDDTKSTGRSTVSSKKEEAVVGWAGLHCSFTQMVNMRELILLDSDSTDTVFCNPKYVTNIRDSNNPMSISTNGGELKSYKKCDIPHIDNVWFNENAITNIISMKNMTDKFRVTMDQRKNWHYWYIRQIKS